MTKLIELKAKFLTYHKADNGQVSHREVPTIDTAQGVMYLCPLCWAKNNGPVGTHSVICWDSTRGVPDDAFPAPGRWKLVGTSIDDLSLMEVPGKSRSVLLTGGCGWHGFVTDGDASVL